MKIKVMAVEETLGIGIPRRLLEISGLKDEVEVEAQKGSLIFRKAGNARQGWDKSFGEMAAKGDDQLILQETAPNRWDEEKWEW
jgi:antitoxin MazE